MAQNNSKLDKRAVVMGASLGGLLAARALSDYFSEVLLLERDALPTESEQRKGVPQGRHLHNLLLSGKMALENLYPGLTDELVAQGAHLISPKNVSRCWEGSYHCDFESPTKSITLSRPLLEATVRQRTLALPNIRVIERCDVLGLTTTPDRSTINGVKLIRRQSGSAEETLEAALVVDATGRGSRTPAWLEELGYGGLITDKVGVGISYATQYLRCSASVLGDKKFFVVGTTKANPRFGVLMAEEGDRCIVTLGSYFGDPAPLDAAGFLEFARTLAGSDIYRILQASQPLSELVQYKFPHSQRRRYEKLKKFPAGLLVFGDAICSFNPIYGQGMSVAALEAQVLQQCLERWGNSQELAPNFFKQAAKTIDIPWQLAVGGDLGFPQTDGPHSRKTKFLSWYIRKLHIAARQSPTVAEAFIRVVNLLAPPPSLLQPRIAWQVWKYNRRASPVGQLESVPQ